MAPKDCFLGAVRRRTMICCRNVKISASIAARDRNRSTTAQTMSLTRSLITDQHRPILGQPPANRFAKGTASTIEFTTGTGLDGFLNLGHGAPLLEQAGAQHFEVGQVISAHFELESEFGTI